MRQIVWTLFFLFSIFLFGEAGVIVPGGYSYPDKNILETSEMRVDVEIINNHANVKIMQIYHNKRDFQMEGEYLFTMPDHAMISNFAIWEDGERLKGVILEKQKARRIYEEIKAKMVDPGLFEKKDGETINKFSVRVFPIPANGYKRIEIQYTELLPTPFLKMAYILPLKPLIFKDYRNEIENFSFSFSLKTDVPLDVDSMDLLSPFDINFKNPSEYLKNVKLNENEINFKFQSRDVNLGEDFALYTPYKIEKTSFSLLTYRDTNKTRIDYSPDNNGKVYQDKNGFFLGNIFVLEKDKEGVEKKIEPKNVLIVFDNSLSMKWLKLVRAHEITNYLLDSLNPEDKFNVIFSNNRAEKIDNALFIDASPSEIEKVKAKINSLLITNGTDLSKLADELKKYPVNTRVYWVTDGMPTIGEIDDKNLESIFSKLKNLTFFVFGIGSDINKKMLTKTASSSSGYFFHFYETENIAPKLKLVDQALSQKPLSNFFKKFDKNDIFHMLYTLDDSSTVFNKSRVSLVGQYIKPINTKLSVEYQKDGEKFSYEFPVNLPEKSIENEFIKRVWAKARIDFLLAQISESGEKTEWINEIIALSKEYTIVTPYTSFLAAPRSMIRPRSIIPGDPVLRVKTDDNIVSVTAKFQFGLVKKLEYLKEKGVWETRFLAPTYLKDGEHSVKLYLIDRNGQTIIENKSIRIDSTPPKMGVSYKLEGNKIKVIADASSDTRRILGYYKNIPFSIKYSNKEGVSIGYMDSSMITEGDSVKFILEDFAHNTTTVEERIFF
ncbi:VWA domain-containing protein [bacterium]|nr:VWA domain-containing protein [bacterium]